MGTNLPGQRDLSFRQVGDLDPYWRCAFISAEIVTPSEVEESRGAIVGLDRGVLRLRCASLRMTTQVCVIKFLAASESAKEFGNLSS